MTATNTPQTRKAATKNDKPKHDKSAAGKPKSRVLGAADFNSQLGALPGLDDLLKKAPAAGGGLGGLLGGLAGAVGGNAALISSIMGGFGKLGLTTDHAKKFEPVILEFLRTRVGTDVALQGNMDPTCLFLPPDQLRERVAEVLASHGSGPGHVFNLGHGVLPQTDPEHVRVMVEAVRELSARPQQ